MFYIKVVIKVGRVLAVVNHVLYIGCNKGWRGTECSKPYFIYRLL